MPQSSGGPTVPVHVRLPRDLVSYLTDACERTGRSRTQYLVKLLDEDRQVRDLMTELPD